MSTACHGAGGTGVGYSYAELEGLWINAGGPASVAPIAAAIALAESGGCSTALNATDNGGTQSSFGLWQISTGTHTAPSASWSNGAVNASLAVGKYKGAGNTFSPWGTYASGAYRAFLNGGTTPVTAGLPTATLTSAAGGANATLAASFNPATCIFGFGGVPGTSWWNDIFGSGGNVAQGCLVTKSNLRAYVGAAVLASGVIVAGAGLLVLAAYGLGKSAALSKAAAVIPGAAPVAAAAVRRSPPKAKEPSLSRQSSGQT